MSAPDPEGVSLLAKVMGALAAVIAPIWGAYKYIDSRFDKKADKEDVKRALEHIERLYQNAEGDRKLTRDLVDSMRDHIDTNHRHVVGIILGNRNAP